MDQLHKDMKLKEIKEWIDSLPDEFLEFDVVNAELGKIETEDDLMYRYDKPITALNVSEETKEILFLNAEPENLN